MFELLSKHVKRLFAAGTNNGKQVPKLTNELHMFKLASMALSIALLLGHSTFRAHFDCDGKGLLNSEKVTNFCMMNGTTTVLADEQRDLPETHAGLSFAHQPHGHKLFYHAYMRSLWLLLILIALCSYCAQRSWASLFKHDDTLKALLQLPEYEKSKLVMAAEKARPYETLSRVSRAEIGPKIGQRDDRLSRAEQLTQTIAVVDDYVNIYDSQLDYYPNQLIYLLLTGNTHTYRRSIPKLRRKMIVHSIYSTCCTWLQFALPVAFLGRQYETYGWQYALLLKNYILELLRVQKPVSFMNSIDYKLSVTIFPIMTQCQYRQHALTGDEDSVTVICTVGMNEICGKLFVVIWWVVVINIAVELWSLMMFLVASISSSVMSYTFGYRFWPDARKQANLIASFRYRRLKLLEAHYHMRSIVPELTTNYDQNKGSANNVNLSAREKKRLEAELAESGRRPSFDSEASSYRSRDYSPVCSCLRQVARFITKIISGVLGCLSNSRRKYYNRERKVDEDIFVLLYLLYLRLGKSRSRLEDVICMTSVALENYLTDLEMQQRQAKPRRPMQKQPQVEPFHQPQQVIKADLEERKQLNKQKLNKEGTTIVDVMM